MSRPQQAVFPLRLPHGVHLKLAMQEAADLVGLFFPRSNYKNVQRENFLSLYQSPPLLTGIVIICPTTAWASDLFALLREGQFAHSG